MEDLLIEVVHIHPYKFSLLSQDTRAGIQMQMEQIVFLICTLPKLRRTLINIPKKEKYKTACRVAYIHHHC